MDLDAQGIQFVFNLNFLGLYHHSSLSSDIVNRNLSTKKKLLKNDKSSLTRTFWEKSLRKKPLDHFGK